MRNRTELVTNTLAESDNEEEELDDSEEDWKPQKVHFEYFSIHIVLIFWCFRVHCFCRSQKTGRGATKVVSPKGGKRKSAGSRGRPASKKSKQDESEEDDIEDEEENEDDEDENEDDDIDSEEEDSDGEKPKKGGKSAPKRGRAAPSGKNQPDKDGVMELYLFKNDLTKEFRSDPKLCLWRRDGASLLQKYLVVKSEDESRDIFFNASSVYSCWEEKRKNDFFQIKVQLIGEKKDGKVKVVDIDELEKFAAEDRPQVDLTHKGADSQEAANDDEGNDGFDGEDDEEEEEWTCTERLCQRFFIPVYPTKPIFTLFLKYYDY